MNTDGQWSKQEACFARANQVRITTPVSLLANEFTIRSVLHGQVCLAAVIFINVFHEVINGYKNLEIH